MYFKRTGKGDLVVLFHIETEKPRPLRREEVRHNCFLILSTVSLPTTIFVFFVVVDVYNTVLRVGLKPLLGSMGEVCCWLGADASRFREAIEAPRRGREEWLG